METYPALSNIAEIINKYMYLLDLDPTLHNE